MSEELKPWVAAHANAGPYGWEIYADGTRERLCGDMTEVAARLVLAALNSPAPAVQVPEELSQIASAAAAFFGWYNRHYPTAPSEHPDHPWNRLGMALTDYEAAAPAPATVVTAALPDAHNCDFHRDLTGRCIACGLTKAPATVATEVDPCPNCPRGSICKTPTCGRLAVAYEAGAQGKESLCLTCAKKDAPCLIPLPGGCVSICAMYEKKVGAQGGGVDASAMKRVVEVVCRELFDVYVSGRIAHGSPREVAEHEADEMLAAVIEKAAPPAIAKQEKPE